MKISKKLALCLVILLLALFIFCLDLVLVYSAEKGAEKELLFNITIVQDDYAVTQIYDTFFTVFTEELLLFVKEEGNKISGRHRVFVLEFYRMFYPTDKMIFIYLDLNESLKEPLLVHREMIGNLVDAKTIRVFAAETVENLIRIINENRQKKHKT